MDIQREKIKELLDKLKSGEVTSEEAITYLTTLPYEDVGFAKLDHHRTLRKGFPEVVLGQGKTGSQISTLANAVLDRSDRVLATRIGRDVFDEVKDSIPDAEYYGTARLLVVDRREYHQHIPGVVVASGGTSDEFVAQEAAVTAELMDCEVVRLVDVGVAGIHRGFTTSADFIEGDYIYYTQGENGKTEVIDHAWTSVVQRTSRGNALFLPLSRPPLHQPIAVWHRSRFAHLVAQKK
mgnify:CR=1 FL=1